MITYKGWNPPVFGGHQNVMSRQAGDKLIKNDLLQLILTSPGERVMRPNFGTIVKKSVFEQLDDMLFDDIRDDITNKISTYEPRVRAIVNVSRDSVNENLLIIKVSGVLTNDPSNAFEAEVKIPLNSGATK